MKLIIAIGLFGIGYQYPMTFVLTVIAVMFVLEVISKCINAECDSKASYEMIKEILNDETSDNYLEDKVQEKISEESELITPTLQCQEVNWKKWNYRDIQSMCRSNGIARVNRKKKVLIAALNSV